MVQIGTLFSGFGGVDIGAQAAGIEHAWGLEYDADIAGVAETNEFSAVVANILEVDPRDFEAVDVLHASPPCFPSGVRVLTKHGLVDISSVAIGDEVVTHLGRWRVVTSTTKRKSNTIILHGLGHYGLECTANHPFLSSVISYIYPPYKERRPGNYVSSVMTEPLWVHAGDMQGKHWLALSEYPQAAIPELEYRGNEALRGQVFNLESSAFWQVIGRWVGDGWIRYKDKENGNSQRGMVYICAGKHEKDQLKKMLNDAGIVFFESEERTTYHFAIYSRPLCRWLASNFGEGAQGKRIPAWLLGSPLIIRESFLRGYVSADGCVVSPQSYKNDVVAMSTISSDLAIGLRMLGLSLGYSVSVKCYERNRDVKIEGRSVTERPTYTVRMATSERHSKWVGDKYRSGVVRKITQGRNNVDVYDITVSDDESFIADGIVVHNCPNFSTAKVGRKETANDVAMARAVAGFIEELQPKVFTLENVYGYRKAQGFATILAALDSLGYMYSYAHVNAADFGVPQSRRRLWLRAIRGALVPALPPAEKWVGWYQAIEDLIPGLPESEFAPWQLKRLPEKLQTLFAGGANTSNEQAAAGVGISFAGEPTRTVNASNAINWRALLVGAGGYNGNIVTTQEDDPSFTVTANQNQSTQIRGFIVPGGNASSFSVRRDDQPSCTVGDVERAGNIPRAFLVGQDYDKPNTNLGRHPVSVMPDDPVLVVKAFASNRQWRAWLSQGRVVAMTPRCLARFQSFPDWYVLPERRALACKGIGNAVPSLLYQKLIAQFVGYVL